MAHVLPAGLGFHVSCPPHNIEPCADGEVESESEHVVVERELEPAAETLPVGRVRFVVSKE